MEKTEIKKPTIQERIATRVNEICDPVEVWLDRFNNNPDRFNPDTLKLVPLFKKEKVGGVHARKIQERYEELYKEFKDLFKDHLKENLKKVNLKSFKVQNFVKFEIFFKSPLKSFKYL